MPRPSTSRFMIEHPAFRRRVVQRLLVPPDREDRRGVRRVSRLGVRVSMWT
jgi:hypothetical protein